MVLRANRYVHGIVLAGVHLWEDSAFNNITPRPLLPVVQRPLISHVLRWLRHGGIEEATICANSTSRLVRKYLDTGAQWNMDLDYYEDWTPRGPAGCIHDAALDSTADTHIVVDGTIVPEVDLSDLLASHERSKAWATVAVSPEPPSGAISPAPLVPSGIYVFDHRALEMIGRTGYQDIKEVLIPKLHQAGHPVATYVAPSRCPRVCDLASYLQANSWILEQMADSTGSLAHYRKVQESHIHCDAHVAPSARLIGPVLVGSGASIQDGSIIVGPCVIGADTIVEDSAVVSRSVLWENCHVGAQAYVDRSVLVEDASVRPGARLYGATLAPSARPDGRLPGWLLARRDGTDRHVDQIRPDRTRTQDSGKPLSSAQTGSRRGAFESMLV